MRIPTLAVVAFGVAMGVASVASAAPNGGWKGPINDFLNGNNGSSSSQNLSSAERTTLVENSTQSVPVPGTLLLFGGGFAAFAIWHQRLRRG